MSDYKQLENLNATSHQELIQLQNINTSTAIVAGTVDTSNLVKCNIIATGGQAMQIFNNDVYTAGDNGLPQMAVRNDNCANILGTLSNNCYTGVSVDQYGRQFVSETNGTNIANYTSLPMSISMRSNATISRYLNKYAFPAGTIQSVTTPVPVYGGSVPLSVMSASFPYLPYGATGIQISSDSASDDNTQILIVKGYVMNSLVLVTEPIALNGQTPVTLTNGFVNIESIQFDSSSSLGYAAGNIYVTGSGATFTAGVPNGRVITVIDQFNTSLAACQFMPKPGKTIYFDNMTINTDGADWTVELRIYTNTTNLVADGSAAVLPNYGCVFTAICGAYTGSSLDLKNIPPLSRINNSNNCTQYILAARPISGFKITFSVSINAFEV